MAKNDPLGCPFCGRFEVDINRTNPNACWVSCADCGAEAPSHRTRNGAIANWNRRETKANYTTASIRDDDDREHWTGQQRKVAA